MATSPNRTLPFWIFGGFGKFRVRWGLKGPTSPSPSFLVWLFRFFCFVVFVCLLIFLGCVCVCVCFGDFRVGRGPKAPPHLTVPFFHCFWLSLFGCFLCSSKTSCFLHFQRDVGALFLFLLKKTTLIVSFDIYDSLPVHCFNMPAPKPSFLVIFFSLPHF